jgi:hypothetical protein
MNQGGYGNGGQNDGFGPPGGSPFAPPPIGSPGQGFGRFGKYIAVGGLIGGVLSSIPLLNMLNCCFCLLVVVGVGAGLSMHLSANPDDSLTAGESAGFGAATGAAAGLVAGLLGTLVSVLFSGVMLAGMKNLPPEFAKQMAMQSGMGLVAIPIYMILFGTFGSLGGFLVMEAGFKHRLRSQ